LILRQNRGGGAASIVVKKPGATAQGVRTEMCPRTSKGDGPKKKKAPASHREDKEKDCDRKIRLGGGG